MEKLIINGQGVKQFYSCALEDGSYAQLLQPLKVKPKYSYSWPDRDGEDVDPNEITRFESLTYTFSLIFSCGSFVALETKFNNLINVLKSPNGSVWQFSELNKSYRLHLQEVTSIQEINLINGSARITLTLKNNWQ